MAGKNIATKSNGGIKIVELGTELRVDPRQIVAAAQEMAMENAKVPASWVTAGQADRLRAKFGGQGELKARIERKLRHFESALETPTEMPKVDKVAKAHNEKMGKKMFESDRRNIFGVVANADGVRVEPPAPPHKKHAHKVDSAEETSPSNELAAPVAETPAKKFIQVTVAPPIRRDPNTPDPRFGVIVPSTESVKKDGPPAIWSNLKDGRAPVDFSTTLADDAKAASKSKHEESTKVEPEPVEEKKVASRHSGRKARVEAAHHEATAAPESSAVAPSVSEETPREEHHRKRHVDVPVKWQPKNKAFGAKVTHKTKVLKKLETKGGEVPSSKQSKAEIKEKREHKAAEKHHSPQEKSAAHEPKRSSERKSERAQEQQPEGVFSRLIRKIFKK